MLQTTPKPDPMRFAAKAAGYQVLNAIAFGGGTHGDIIPGVTLAFASNREADEAAELIGRAAIGAVKTLEII